VIAAGQPIDVDLSKLGAGQQIVVLWRGTPIFVSNRPPKALDVLRDASL
jgi:ubiquinol-cytochrome c reductase iron-sulfur subunit